MNILHVKLIKLTHILVFTVLSLPSLLFLSKDFTPSHTTRDAFTNYSLAFSRDVSLGHLWYRYLFTDALLRYDSSKIEFRARNKK